MRHTQARRLLGVSAAVASLAGFAAAQQPFARSNLPALMGQSRSAAGMDQGSVTARRAEAQVTSGPTADWIAVAPAANSLARYDALLRDQDAAINRAGIAPFSGWARVRFDPTTGEVQISASDLQQLIGTAGEPAGYEQAGDVAVLKPPLRTTGTSLPTGGRQLIGKIRDLYIAQEPGSTEGSLVAEVETPSGRRGRVDLGPVAEVQKIGPRVGESLMVRGSLGTLADPDVVLARWINLPGRSLYVTRPEGDVERYDGTVIDTEKLAVDAPDKQDMVATVRLRDGNVARLDLGPRRVLGDNVPSRGQQITVMAVHGTVGGQPALIAERLDANGQVIALGRRQRSTLGEAGGGYREAGYPEAGEPGGD